MHRVILIHGNGDSSGQDNWFPWLSKELKQLGVPCEAPNFPNPKFAKADEWPPFLEDRLHADGQTVLVGHSSGAVAAMRYAEQHRIYGSVLVGTYYTDLGDEGERVSGYFSAPWNWEAIKNNQNWTVIFASKDDPYIPIAEPQFIKDKLGSEYHEYDNEGHFGEDIKKVTFPDLLEVLKRRLQL